MRRLLLAACLLSALPFRGRAQDESPKIDRPGVDEAARELARLIATAREQAIAAGVHSIPTSIYRGLLGYFPDALLRKVRFSSDARNDELLPMLAFSFGDAEAITLSDVILFRDRGQSEHDLKLWAHELTHVLQYQRWGIDGFAERYLRDSESVEREAYANADRFAAWRAGR